MLGHTLMIVWLAVRLTRMNVVSGHTITSAEALDLVLNAPLLSLKSCELGLGDFRHHETVSQQPSQLKTRAGSQSMCAYGMLTAAAPQTRAGSPRAWR
jgi:hypothetical protein